MSPGVKGVLKVPTQRSIAEEKITYHQSSI